MESLQNVLIKLILGVIEEKVKNDDDDDDDEDEYCLYASNAIKGFVRIYSFSSQKRWRHSSWHMRALLHIYWLGHREDK